MASDDALLAVLTGLDALLAQHGVSKADLREAWREAHEPAPIPDGLVNITEAARLLGTSPAALRQAVLDRTWTPETHAPLYRRSPAGILWSITQVDAKARAQHERKAARGLYAVMEAKPSRAGKPKPTPPPDTVPVAPPWLEPAA